MIITKESAPHIRRKPTVSRMMIDVLIALAPTLIFALIIYPIQGSINLLISLVIMIGAELVYIGLRNMMPKDGLKHSFKEKFLYAYKGKVDKNNILTPAISAVIFTLIMPPTAPVYAIIVGALVGIIFGKLVFGGLGSNIFNPAAVGMVFAKLCFSTQYSTFVDLKEQSIVSTWFYDASAGATPLEAINHGNYANLGNYSLTSMLFGQIPGTLGEVFKLTIIVGLIYSLIRRSIDWRIVVSYLGTFAGLMLIAGLSVHALNSAINPFIFMTYNLLGGAVLFGAVFMLTDPVTSPINSPSRVMYGIIAAILTVFIRLFAALPEGVGFSILLANMVAVFLDHYEWSSAKYTWKKILAIVLLVVIPALVTFLIIRFGGVYNG